MNSALMLHRHASPAVAGSYTVGAVAGACTTGAVLFVLSGLLSPIPGSLRSGLAICVILLLALHAVGVLCLDLPQRRYQIPRETFTSSPTTAAYRFAYELGTGVRTYVTATAPYCLAVALVLALPGSLASSALSALLAAVGYGLGRSVVVATQTLRSTIAVEHPKRWLRMADLIAVTTALAIAIASVA